jgi:hypothetical protein
MSILYFEKLRCSTQAFFKKKIMEEHQASSPQVKNQIKVIIEHKCLKQKQSIMPNELSLYFVVLKT